MTPRIKEKTDTEKTTVVIPEVLANDIAHIKDDITDIKKYFEKMERLYLTRIEFEPVKKIVYGLVSIVLIAVVGGLLALVLR